MSRYLLDSNTVSALVHKRSRRLQAKVDTLRPDDSLAISVITEGEVRFGIARVPGATRLARTVETVLASFDILPWTSETAEVYARFRAENQRLGLAAGPLDMLIAAHAVAESAVLVTSDQAIAKLRGGLVVEEWADDLRPN